MGESMNDTNGLSERALQLFEPEEDTIYTIEAAARITHAGRHAILVYCKYGLVSPVSGPEASGYTFDHKGIRALRRIEHLHTDREINLAGTSMILDLMNQVERLTNELRILRQ